MDLLLVLFVVVVAIVAHEVAHAVVATAVGHEVSAVQVGVLTVARFRLAGIDVELGALPLGGSVQTGMPGPVHDDDGFRWRTALVAAAGPATNGALALASAAVGLGPAVVFNVIAAVVNLWPGIRRPVQGSGSDGRVILEMVIGRPDLVADERSGWWVARAAALRELGDTDAAAEVVADGIAQVGRTRPLLAMSGLLAFAQRRFRDVVDAYVDLIDDPVLPVELRAAFAADAAWAASLSRDRTLAPSAEPWAALGASVGRDARRTVIHALALVGADRPQEARTLLVGRDDPLAVAVDALALAALGFVDDARTQIRERVQGRLDDDHPLWPRLLL